MSYQRYNFAQPTMRDVRPVDPVLTNLSFGFRNERFLYDQIAPNYRSSEKSGRYTIFTRDYWFRRQGGATRAATSPYLRLGYGVEFATFDTVEIGFEKVLGDPIRASSQTPEDLQRVDVEFLVNQLQMEMEVQAAAELFVTGVWGTSTTLTGTNQWSDYANSDPIADSDLAIRTILRNTGARPNTLFVGLVGWEKLKEHPLVLDKYKHTQTAIMTPQLVAAVLGIQTLVVGDTVRNTANEGSAFVGADIWTDNALYLVKNTPGLGVANGAYTYIWDEKGNFPWAVENYRDENVRADVTRVFTHRDYVITSSQHGYLLLDTAA
jgi:hypothetical protein